MAWIPADDMPDQSGKVAAVTGANGGLGLETARELAGKGAHVVMAARNLDKAEAARASIISDHPHASLEVIPLDLGNLGSVHTAAEQILATHSTIDILVNNAGVMGIPERQTDDGFEMQLGTNHLGHFVFTAGLMPSLIRAGAGRVVTVTSTARHFGRPVDPDNPHLRGTYGPWKAYGQSKLANLHFALELQRRFEAAGLPLRSLVAHPGYSNTNLQAHSAQQSDGLSQRFFHVMVDKVGMQASEGARPQLRAATDPAANGGELYAPRYVNNGPAVRRPLVGRSHSRKAMATLWEVSERETGIEFDVARIAAEVGRS
jgi:NAD(P)-dependent dehydrogenase (short-subunit alcohol dehydrogenase family)